MWCSSFCLSFAHMAQNLSSFLFPLTQDVCSYTWLHYRLQRSLKKRFYVLTLSQRTSLTTSCGWFKFTNSGPYFFAHERQTWHFAWLNLDVGLLLMLFHLCNSVASWYRRWYHKSLSQALKWGTSLKAPQLCFCFISLRNGPGAYLYLKENAWWRCKTTRYAQKNQQRLQWNTNSLKLCTWYLSLRAAAHL